MPDGNTTAPQLVDDHAISAALRDATKHLNEIKKFSANTTLEDLSSKTVFTGIDVFEDSIFSTADGYSAPATIYAELNFGDGKAKTLMGSSFPGRVTFKMTNGQAELLDITVDTSSFQSAS